MLSVVCVAGTWAHTTLAGMASLWRTRRGIRHSAQRNVGSSMAARANVQWLWVLVVDEHISCWCLAPCACLRGIVIACVQAVRVI